MEERKTKKKSPFSTKSTTISAKQKGEKLFGFFFACCQNRPLEIKGTIFFFFC